MRAAALLMVASLLGGCSAQQLTQHVADLSETTSKIENDQIFANLSAFIEEPYRAPSHVTLGTGTAQATRSLTGSMTLPQFDFSQPTRSGTASGTLGSAIQWQMAPITDPDDLKRLQALYQFAIHCAGTAAPGHAVCTDFASEYPAIGTRPGSSMRDPRREVARMRERWLFWDDMPRPATAVLTGTYGRHTLYMIPSGYDRFRQYIRTSIWAPDPPAPASRRAAAAAPARTPATRPPGPPRAPQPQFTPNLIQPF